MRWAQVFPGGAVLAWIFPTAFLVVQDGAIRVAVGRPTTAEDPLLTPAESALLVRGVMSGR